MELHTVGANVLGTRGQLGGGRGLLGGDRLWDSPGAACFGASLKNQRVCGVGFQAA